MFKGFGVVVDAFGAWTPDTLPQHSTSLMHLCDILSGSDIRLLVVGGAGSLYINAEHTLQVMDGSDFPEIFKPLAAAQGKALEELRKRNDVKWTFISPAGDFQADGKRTGKYILAGEELTLNSKGESIISYVFIIFLVSLAIIRTLGFRVVHFLPLHTTIIVFFTFLSTKNLTSHQIIFY